MTATARPDNSHLYAAAYADVKGLAEQLTERRQPSIPRTVLAAAMLEIVEELMADRVRNVARECIAELAGRTLGEIARPLPFEARAKLDQSVAELMR